MYTQLMYAALEKLDSSTHEETSGQALAGLLRCRHRLSLSVSREGTDAATAAVADQLAYDIALIEFARRLGVECDVSDFDNPGHGRALLERGLEFRGVRLGAIDVESAPRYRRN